MSPQKINGPVCWLLAGFLVVTQFVSGCAVHYGDSRTGVEKLWGFGQLKMENQMSNSHAKWATVTTGIRVPGLCLEIGRDHFGFNFGYLDREQLVLVGTTATADLEQPDSSAGIRLAGNTNSSWAFGYLHMRSVAAPTHHYAIVTGKALAGLGAGLGGHDNSLGFVLDGRQTVVVSDDSMSLDFDQKAPGWPGFNLFAMHVDSPTLNNSNKNNEVKIP